MQASRTVRSAKELRAVSNHLHYEVWMLQSTAKGLASGVFGKGNTVANAMLEAFAIHLRVVVDFLYPRGRGLKDDDVLAWDFFDSSEQWGKVRDKHIIKESRKVLKDARNKTDKEMAHLTYSRLKVTATEKNWYFAKVADEAQKAIKVFVDNISNEKLGPGWFLSRFMTGFELKRG
jgi:hypothetical protein